MTIEEMTKEQKVNLTLLNYFYEKGTLVHLKLIREDDKGHHIFLNGRLVVKLSDNEFLLNERVIGHMRISLFEIRDGGVQEGRVRG